MDIFIAKHDKIVGIHNHLNASAADILPKAHYYDRLQRDQVTFIKDFMNENVLSVGRVKNKYYTVTPPKFTLG